MNKTLKNMKFTFFVFLICSILISVIEMVLSIIEGYAIDSVLKTLSFIKNDPFLTFGTLIIILILANVVLLVSNYFYFTFHNKLLLYVAKSISKNFYSDFLNTNAKGMKKYSPDLAFNSIINNGSAITYQSIIPFAQLTAILVNLLFIFLFFGITNWVILLIVLAIFTLSTIPNLISVKKAKMYTEQKQISFNQLSSKLTYWIDRYTVLYYANKENMLYSFIEKEILDYYLKTYKRERFNIFNNSLSQFVVEAGEIIGIIILVFMYFKNDSSVSIGMIYIFKKVIENSKTEFLDFISEFKKFVASKEIYKLLETNLEKEENQLKLDSIEQIEIKNLNLSFDNKVIFKDFNQTFSKGQKYALIGASGSGKSTLLSILLNDLDNYQGQVLINNQDIKNFNDKSIKNAISYLDNQNFVFDKNVSENVSLLENDEQKIKEALEFVGLNKELEPNAFSSDFDSFTSLSLGQKQRLALSRLIYFNKDFIILDESLSNLNKELAQQILNKFLDSNKTLIYVSHHLDSKQLNKFNKIINLNEI
ncbi:ATP-binding cassette domain-containing protein [Mycoplasma sp. 1012]